MQLSIVNGLKEHQWISGFCHMRGTRKQPITGAGPAVTVAAALPLARHATAHCPFGAPGGCHARCGRPFQRRLAARGPLRAAGAPWISGQRANAVARRKGRGPAAPNPQSGCKVDSAKQQLARAPVLACRLVRWSTSSNRNRNRSPLAAGDYTMLWRAFGHDSSGKPSR